MQRKIPIIIIKAGLAKCKSCGYINGRAWFYGNASGDCRSHFPLVCDECGQHSVFRIEFSELTKEEKTDLYRRLIRYDHRCLKCGHQFVKRRPDKPCPKCKSTESYRIAETFDDYDPEIDG